MTISSKYSKILFLLCSFLLSQPLFPAEITIESPLSGFTSKRIQEIKGSIRNYNKDFAHLIVNGIPQNLPLQSGRFNLRIVIAPGNNLIEIIADNSKKSVSFFADVPKKDVKIVLTWDTMTDVDLWVIDPKGEKCYYGHSSTSNGGNLDVDNTSGFGPETFTMANALPGNYSVQVQYYSGRGAPVTRVDIYMILKEGTPGETRKHASFIMTKEHAVYHITDLQIDAED